MKQTCFCPNVDMRALQPVQWGVYQLRRPAMSSNLPHLLRIHRATIVHLRIRNSACQEHAQGRGAHGDVQKRDGTYERVGLV